MNYIFLPSVEVNVPRSLQKLENISSKKLTGVQASVTDVWVCRKVDFCGNVNCEHRYVYA